MKVCTSLLGLLAVGSLSKVAGVFWKIEIFFYYKPLLYSIKLEFGSEKTEAHTLRKDTKCVDVSVEHRNIKNARC